MKKFLTILIVFLCITSLPLYAGDEAYIMGDIDTLPSDFYLNVSIAENNVNIVDKICTFQVENPNSSGLASLCDISFFKDNNFIRMYPKVSFPFSIKRNYRGIQDGDYQITFIAKNKNGKIGKGSITIRVRH